MADGEWVVTSMTPTGSLESPAQLAQFESLSPSLGIGTVLVPFGQASVAYSSISETVTALDSVAAVVAQLFDGSATVAELVGDIHEVIGIPATIARAQVRRTIEILEGADLLEASTGAPAAEKLDLFPAPPNP